MFRLSRNGCQREKVPGSGGGQFACEFGAGCPADGAIVRAGSSGCEASGSGQATAGWLAGWVCGAGAVRAGAGRAGALAVRGLAACGLGAGFAAGAGWTAGTAAASISACCC